AEEADGRLCQVDQLRARVDRQADARQVGQELARDPLLRRRPSLRESVGAAPGCAAVGGCRPGLSPRHVSVRPSGGTPWPQAGLRALRASPPLPQPAVRTHAATASAPETKSRAILDAALLFA